MARVIDKDYLLKHKRKVRFFGIGPDDESWGYAVPTEVIEKAPTLTPPNEPLSIEQLRQMDGEPVWCKELKSWALIYTEGGKWEPHLILPDLSPVVNFPIKTHSRTYTLYRRPPEGEEDA